jgi:hypothetical protein
MKKNYIQPEIDIIVLPELMSGVPAASKNDLTGPSVPNGTDDDDNDIDLHSKQNTGWTAWNLWDEQLVDSE